MLVVGANAWGIFTIIAIVDASLPKLGIPGAVLLAAVVAKFVANEVTARRRNKEIEELEQGKYE